MLTVLNLPNHPEPDAYPGDASLRERLEYLAKYALKGAELFGSQPWNLTITDAGFEVRPDKNARLRKVDPDGRETLIAVGTAVFMLRLALRCHLLEPSVAELQGGGARISVVGDAEATPEESELFSLLTAGMPDACGIPPLDVLAPEIQGLIDAARLEGVRLRYVENEFLRSVTASMLQAGDKIVFQRESECAEFRRWLGVRSTQTPSVSEFVSWPVFQTEVAEFCPAEGEVPAVAVLCTEYDDSRHWLNTGMALGHIHLLAAALGMRMRVFNQPLQVPGMRARFARETGFCNFPQVVLRFGYDMSKSPGRSAALSDAIRQSLLTTSEACECGCDGDCGGDDEGSSRY